MGPMGPQGERGQNGMPGKDLLVLKSILILT